MSQRRAAFLEGKLLIRATTLLPNDGTGNASFYAAPISALAVVLSNFAGRPVENKTGLTGRYDMSFRRPIPGAPSTERDSTSNAPPTIFEVVEGFGLKLEPAKRLRRDTHHRPYRSSFGQSVMA
jgi:uncharacterized protein (TIGR03435 family)